MRLSGEAKASPLTFPRKEEKVAEFKGRRCDRNGCSTVVENVHTTPGGWIKMQPIIATDVREAENIKEYCSNYCLAIVAVDRYEEESGKKFQRVRSSSDRIASSDARVEGGRRAAHTRMHTNKGVINPNCAYCVLDTTPGGNNGKEAATT